MALTGKGVLAVGEGGSSEPRGLDIHWDNPLKPSIDFDSTSLVTDISALSCYLSRLHWPSRLSPNPSK